MSEPGDGAGSASGSGTDRTQTSPKRHGILGAASRVKMNYACEACRLAKVKCHPGSAESGVCKRCSEFKRECVFRTGPRTRRSKYSQMSTASTPLPPPPGPSKTFSINFDMPVEETPDSEFAQLREIHERTIATLYEPEEESDTEYDGSFGDGRKAAESFSFNDMSTQPAPSSLKSSAATSLDPGVRANISCSGSCTKASMPEVKTQSLHNLGMKPQFNLESATKLIDCFRSMLVQCPIIVLPPEADVRSMARESPFVLLAILAVTSCTTSLQGYSLYDEEFRKVLGLKFVAGGERSLELLQGLIIYCAWYPFHLRPKSKHGMQYLRMAADIVRDLELDQEDGMQIPAEDKLASIRAFLGCVCLDTISSMSWFKGPAFTASPWLTKCCAILEQSSSLYHDHVLVWLTRFQQVGSEVYTQFCYQHKWTAQDNYQRELMRLGLVSRLREVQNGIPLKYATATSIVICSLFTDVYVLAAIIMRAPRPSFKPHSSTSSSSRNTADPHCISNQDLIHAAQAARTFFDFFAGLTSKELSTLSACELGRTILVFTVAFRVSFPLPRICPDLDYKRTREILNFDWYLAKLSKNSEDREESDNEHNIPNNVQRNNNEAHNPSDSPAEASSSTNAKPKKSKTDVATALRVVIGSLRNTYARKIAVSDAAASTSAHDRTLADIGTSARDGMIDPGLEQDVRRLGCPIIDGSMDNFISSWGGQHDQQYHSRYYQVPHPGTHAHLQNYSQLQQQQHPSPGILPDTYGAPEWCQPAPFVGTGATLEGTSSSSLSPFSSGYATSHSGHSSSISTALLGGGSIGPGSTSGTTADGVIGGAGSGPDPGPGTGSGPAVFHDLWDAMTMGWTDSNMVDVVGVLHEESP